MMEEIKKMMEELRSEIFKPSKCRSMGENTTVAEVVAVGRSKKKRKKVLRRRKNLTKMRKRRRGMTMEVRKRKKQKKTKEIKNNEKKRRKTHLRTLGAAVWHGCRRRRQREHPIIGNESCWLDRSARLELATCRMRSGGLDHWKPGKLLGGRFRGGGGASGLKKVRGRDETQNLGFGEGLTSVGEGGGGSRRRKMNYLGFARVRREKASTNGGRFTVGDCGYFEKWR